MEVADATMLMPGVTIGFTVIVLTFEFPVAGEAQVAFDVKITVILSLFSKVFDVNVVELVPTFTPFTCH